MKDAVECRNVTTEDNEKDTRNINIFESEGQRVVIGAEIELPDVTEPIKTRKVNIGTKEQPKFSNIGYYSDEDTMGTIAELLTEYKVFFPTKFCELKGIIGDLVVMRITLKLDSRPIKQRPYRLNPKYKKKVKKEQEKMVAA